MRWKFFHYKMHWKNTKFIANDFTIKMHWKCFYYKNAFEMFLL